MELSIGLSNNNITESPRETHSLQCRRCGNGVGFCGRCQPDRTAKPRPRRPSSAPNSALAAEPPDAAATRLTITRWPEAANDAADERTEAAAAGRSDGTAAAPGWFGTAATDRHATESTGRLMSPASVRLRASGDWGNSIPAIASAAINASS